MTQFFNVLYAKFNGTAPGTISRYREVVYHAVFLYARKLFYCAAFYYAVESNELGRMAHNIDNLVKKQNLNLIK